MPQTLLFYSLQSNVVDYESISLKYQRFTPSGCKEIEIRKIEFVVKNQLLYNLAKTFNKDPGSGSQNINWKILDFQNLTFKIIEILYW